MKISSFIQALIVISFLICGIASLVGIYFEFYRENSYRIPFLLFFSLGSGCALPFFCSRMAGDVINDPESKKFFTLLAIYALLSSVLFALHVLRCVCQV